MGRINRGRGRLLTASEAAAGEERQLNVPLPGDVSSHRPTAARILARHRLDPSEHLHPTCRCSQPWPCDLVEYARLVGEDNPPRLGASRIRPLVKARQAECLAASILEQTDAHAARRVGIGVDALRSHLASLYMQLGIRGRSAAAKKLGAAQTMGWLCLPNRYRA